MFEEETEQKSLFDLEMDYEEVLEIPEDYLQVRLSEMEDKEAVTKLTEEYYAGGSLKDTENTEDMAQALI